MSLSMHNLKPAKGARPKVKRLGRGNSSGKGKTAGRGTKGQAARTGGRGGRKLRGLRRLMLSTPKLRGKGRLTPKPKAHNVRLGDLEKAFAAGETVSPANLLKKGLIASVNQGVKILVGGKLTKKLHISGCNASAAAKAKIEELGGEFRA